jgi:hypothetical protein
MIRVFTAVMSLSLLFTAYQAVNAQAGARAQKNEGGNSAVQKTHQDESSMNESHKEIAQEKKTKGKKDEKADQKELENVRERLEKEIKKIQSVKKELEEEIEKVKSVREELEKEKKTKGKKTESEKRQKIEETEKATEQENKEEKGVESENREEKAEEQGKEEKAVEEKKEKTVAPEEKQEERAAVKEKEKKPPEKKKLSIIDKTSREYVALIFGYGGYFPVFDYGKSYEAAHHFSGTVGIYYLNFVGLSPELHVRYADMGSKSQILKFNSSISIVQMFPAIVYRYPVPLPRNTLTVYARIFDGVARVAYSSRNPYFPIFKENITEYINTFGLSTGCYYDVWKGFLLGVDLGYSIIFTAGKPLQAVSVMVTAGWRIL